MMMRANASEWSRLQRKRRGGSNHAKKPILGDDLTADAERDGRQTDQPALQGTSYVCYVHIVHISPAVVAWLEPFFFRPLSVRSRCKAQMFLAKKGPNLPSLIMAIAHPVGKLNPKLDIKLMIRTFLTWDRSKS